MLLNSRKYLLLRCGRGFRLMAFFLSVRTHQVLLMREDSFDIASSFSVSRIVAHVAHQLSPRSVVVRKNGCLQRWHFLVPGLMPTGLYTFRMAYSPFDGAPGFSVSIEMAEPDFLLFTDYVHCCLPQRFLLRSVSNLRKRM